MGKLYYEGNAKFYLYRSLEIVVRRRVGSLRTRLVPAVRYRNAAAAVDWLCTALGFERHHIVTGEEGEILHAHLTLGNDMIMVWSVGDSNLDRLMKQPDEIGGAETQSCYFVVEDADAHYLNAKAAGADVVLDINDDDHGGRGYTCRDPEGHIWSFGTYDPWQRNPAAQSLRLRFAASPGKNLNLPVIMVAILASISVAATAGLMLPRRSAPNEEETRLKQQAIAAYARAEKAAAGATQLAAELTQERSAKNAAERAAREVREQLAHEQGAKETARRQAQQLAQQLAVARAAKDAIELAAKDASEQVARERTAKETAQRATSDTMTALTRERDAKQRAERSAQDALDQLARERHAKEAAERTAKGAREQLAAAQSAKKNLSRPAKGLAAARTQEQNAKRVPENSSGTAMPSIIP